MSWDCELVPLEDERFFETLNGLWTGKKGPFTEAGVIRNTNFTEGGVIDFSNIAFLEVETKQLKSRQLKAGDVIIERSGGGPNRPVGRVVYFDKDDGVFSFSNFTSAIRVKDLRNLVPKFVFYRLMDLYESGGTTDLQRQTTNIRNLDFTTYKERAQFPLLPLPEQQRIAQVLSTVQQAIEQQERLIRTTTELKQALMQKLFTEGLRGEAQKETEIGAVPESWVVVTLGDLGRVVTGTTPSTTVPEYYAPEEADFVAPADIGNTRQVKDSEKKISMAGYAVCRPLPPDSVMCVCIGATIGKVGMSTKLHSATNQQINSIICSKQHDPRFIYYFLLHHAAYWRGFATFGTMPMLSKGAFEKIPVYVPTERAEQSAIADALVAVDNKLEIADKKRDTLQDLFRTLLHELMTGKVRVGEAIQSAATHA